MLNSFKHHAANSNTASANAANTNANDVDAVDGNHCTMLHNVAGQPDPNALRALLQRGANVNAQCNTLTTPLHIAALCDKLENVNILLEANAKVDIRDQLGATPLYTAARFKHIAIVRALLAKGANPNVRNVFGWTALHEAALSASLEVVRILIEESRVKVDVNIGDECGHTPLNKAEMNPNADALISYLKAKGAVKGVYKEPSFMPDYDLMPKFEPKGSSTLLRP